MRLFLASGVLFAFVVASASAEPVPVLPCQIAVAPVMNGVRAGTWLERCSSRVLIHGTSRRAPRAPLQTHAYFAYDDQNVYVAFRCDQAGVRIRSSGNLNDLAAQSVDYVEAQIDTSGNGSRFLSIRCDAQWVTPAVFVLNLLASTPSGSPPESQTTPSTASLWRSLYALCEYRDESAAVARQLLTPCCRDKFGPNLVL